MRRIDAYVCANSLLSETGIFCRDDGDKKLSRVVIGKSDPDSAAVTEALAKIHKEIQSGHYRIDQKKETSDKKQNGLYRKISNDYFIQPVVGKISVDSGDTHVVVHLNTVFDRPFAGTPEIAGEPFFLNYLIGTYINRRYSESKDLKKKSETMKANRQRLMICTTDFMCSFSASTCAKLSRVVCIRHM